MELHTLPFVVVDVIVSSVLMVFAYLVSNRKFAEQLLLPYVDGAGELVVFTAALVGAGLVGRVR